MRIRGRLFRRLNSQAHLRQYTRALRIKHVKSTGTNQRLNGAPVHDSPIDALTEIENILERPTGITRRNNRRHRIFSGAFDCA